MVVLFPTNRWRKLGIKDFDISLFVLRAVARSEILGGLVVLGGDNVSPLVEIGLADLPNIGGANR